MFSKDPEKLKTILKKGFWFYVIRHGVLGWGVPVGIVWSAIMHYLKVIPFFESIFVAMIYFPLGGFFFGSCMWLLLRIASAGLDKRERK